MGVVDRIRELEEEMRSTQYNKATEHHFGVIKAKIARLKEQLETQAKGTASGGGGFSVRKSGDATVILVGFPSVGKSTLLNKLTGANSKVASFAFTTLTVIPGIMDYRGAQIQILDVPGILAGASVGKGRGREVLGTVHNADLILLLVDATQPEATTVLRDELHDVGVRLDQQRPDVAIVKSERGGITINTTIKLTKTTNYAIESVLRELRINNADVTIREDITIDQLIDIVKGNRMYRPSCTVLTKVDLITDKQRQRIRKQVRPDIEISAHTGLNIEALKELIYARLGMIRIFLKERAKPADMDDPMIVRRGATIRTICDKIHRTMSKRFKYARIWGSSKFPGQIIRSIERELKDGDVLEIHVH